MDSASAVVAIVGFSCHCMSFYHESWCISMSQYAYMCMCTSVSVCGSFVAMSTTAYVYTYMCIYIYVYVHIFIVVCRRAYTSFCSYNRTYIHAYLCIPILIGVSTGCCSPWCFDITRRDFFTGHLRLGRS